MNYHRFKKKALAPLVVLPAILGVGIAQAQDTVIDTTGINDSTAIAAQAFQAAAESQARINRLSDSADEALSQYKEQAKLVDGLEVYNAQLRSTIAEQERTLRSTTGPLKKWPNCSVRLRH